LLLTFRWPVGVTVYFQVNDVMTPYL